MRISQAYLALYNVIEACGWALVLGGLMYGVARQESAEEIYERAAPFTKLAQAVSLLETLHAAVGLVPSNPLMAAMQWAGRSNVLFLVLAPSIQLHANWWALVMLGAWAVAETIRYPQYAAAVLGICPGWLTWLRYTMFIPIYPVGVVAEMALMVAALPDLKAQQRYSLALPNPYNWAFEYDKFIQVVLVTYPFLWWQLYSSLLRARSKKLLPHASDGVQQRASIKGTKAR